MRTPFLHIGASGSGSRAELERRISSEKLFATLSNFSSLVINSAFHRAGRDAVGSTGNIEDCRHLKVPASIITSVMLLLGYSADNIRNTKAVFVQLLHISR